MDIKIEDYSHTLDAASRTAGRRMIMTTCKLGEKGCWKDGKCHYIHDCENKVLTNADRIRDMSDDELSWELMLWRCEAVAKHNGVSSVYPDTQKTILKWLQKPAEDG